MNKILYLLSFFILIGCGSKYPYMSELSTVRSVQQFGGNSSLYFYADYNSVGRVLNQNDANFYNSFSGGILGCKQNYALIYSDKKISIEEYVLTKKMFESISEKQKNMSFNEFVKSNKNARELAEYITHWARTNRMECLRPMTRQKVEKYKASLGRRAVIVSPMQQQQQQQVNLNVLVR